MKKIKLIPKIYLIILTFNLVSCSEEFVETPTFDEIRSPESDDIESPKPIESGHTVSYELAGDFSGKLDITFLASQGFTPPDQVIGAEIPWETSYNIPENIQAIGGFANGLYGDGQEGERATLKMYLDGELIETVIREADVNGKLTLPIESYSMEFNNPDGVTSAENIGKEVVYKVDGGFSGALMLVYGIADGSQENIEITELPWEYSFESTEKSLKASLYGLGVQGVEGEMLEFSLLVDGAVIQSDLAVSDLNGHIGLFPSLFLNLE